MLEGSWSYFIGCHLKYWFKNHYEIIKVLSLQNTLHSLALGLYFFRIFIIFWTEKYVLQGSSDGKEVFWIRVGKTSILKSFFLLLLSCEYVGITASLIFSLPIIWRNSVTKHNLHKCRILYERNIEFNSCFMRECI